MELLYYAHTRCAEGSRPDARRVPLLITDYDLGWLEEIMANNEFDVALIPVATLVESFDIEPYSDFSAK